MLRNLSLFTIIWLIGTICLFIYGIVCRFGIYFFWESKYISWSLILICIILVLRDFIKIRKVKKKKTIFHKVGIGFLTFILCIQWVIAIIFFNSEAYGYAVKALNKNMDLIENVGKINNLSLVPLGQVQEVKSGEEVISGYAEMNFIVKGEKKFCDVRIILRKEYGSSWKVEMISIY